MNFFVSNLLASHTVGSFSILPAEKKKKLVTKFLVAYTRMPVLALCSFLVFNAGERVFTKN